MRLAEVAVLCALAAIGAVALMAALESHSDTITEETEMDRALDAIHYPHKLSKAEQKKQDLLADLEQLTESEDPMLECDIKGDDGYTYTRQGKACCDDAFAKAIAGCKLPSNVCVSHALSKHKVAFDHCTATAKEECSQKADDHQRKLFPVPAKKPKTTPVLHFGRAISLTAHAQQVAKTAKKTEQPVSPKVLLKPTKEKTKSMAIASMANNPSEVLFAAFSAVDGKVEPESKSANIVPEKTATPKDTDASKPNHSEETELTEAIPPVSKHDLLHPMMGQIAVFDNCKQERIAQCHKTMKSAKALEMAACGTQHTEKENSCHEASKVAHDKCVRKDPGTEIDFFDDY